MTIRPSPEFQESPNDDERLLAETPAGYWFDLVNISQVKRLLEGEMPPHLRLRFLEYLNESPHGRLSLEAMQVVTPACDMAMKIIAEMAPLSLEDKCTIMRKWNVMAVFVNLNGSLIEAMKRFRYPT